MKGDAMREKNDFLVLFSGIASLLLPIESDVLMSLTCADSDAQVSNRNNIAVFFFIYNFHKIRSITQFAGVALTESQSQCP